MPSLLDALERKYGAKGEANPPIDDMPVAIFVPKRSPRISVPTLLVLNDCAIDSAGDAALLADKCADVVELDLANNKLTDWKEVFAILEQTPRIRFLNLSFNRLSAQIQAAQALNPKWDSLSYLVLNSTYVAWPSVDACLKALPALEELHLSLNNYTHVGLEEPDLGVCESCSRLNPPSGEPVHDNLKKLHFSGNAVSSWREISKLGYAFPNLETLLVNDCPVGTLAPDPCERCGAVSDAKSHDAFPRLRFLNLNNTRLATWDEVDRLAQFPALRSLRIQGWPLWEAWEATEHERRQLVVARLPRVRTLNGGGAVAAAERDAAERAFIRYYADRPEADRPDRYWELVGVHGQLEPLVAVDLRPEKRVRVTLVCGALSEQRTIDVYRTVADLKCRLEGLAGFPASKMRLFYVDQELRDSQGPEEMKYPTKQLYSYNIRSGDEIIIDSKLNTPVIANSDARA